MSTIFAVVVPSLFNMSSLDLIDEINNSSITTWPTTVHIADDVLSTMPQPYDASCDWTNSSNRHVIVSLQTFLVVSSVFVFIGLLGNMASFIVFSSSEMRKISSSVYLLLLSVSDSLYLFSIFCTKTFNILRCWHITSISHDLKNYSITSCILLQYFLDLTSDYSSCLILLFTLERFAAVYWPVQFLEMCTVERARIAAGVTFAVVAISIGPPHHFLLRLYTDYNLCALSDLNGMIVYNLYILEMILFRVLPAFIIAILNGFIVAKVAKISRNKRKLKQYELSVIELKTKSTAQPSTKKENTHSNHNTIKSLVSMLPIKSNNRYNPNEDITENIVDADIEIKPDKNQCTESAAKASQSQQFLQRRQKQKMKRAEDKNLQLTIILILVSTTYLVAYLPTLIHFIIDLLSYGKFMSVNNEARMIARHYTDLLYVSAFATNFFLFTMSGRVFRQQMWKIFCGSSRRNGAQPSCARLLKFRRRTADCDNQT